MATGILSSNWIWTRNAGEKPHQYQCFRKSFDLASRPRLARLEISVDSDFVCWLNGVEVGRGQFSDWPQKKSYTTIKVGPFLKPGHNVLAILAYYRGEDFSEYCKGKPGLIAALGIGRTLIATDSSWKAFPHPAFRFGPMPRVASQMGFTTEFDARKNIPWQELDFDDSKWPAAETICGATEGYWKDLFPRPVPSLDVEPPVSTVLAVQGDFVRDAEDQTTARTIRADALVTHRPWDVFEQPQDAVLSRYTSHPPVPCDYLQPDEKWLTLKAPESGRSGRFMIIDLGREEVGLLTFKLDAPAGTVLDIAHGEHLDDGRVRAAIGNRNFADRYICAEGEQEFTLPFRRLGVRYIEIHFSGYIRPIRLSYIGLRPTILPLNFEGTFSCSDSLADKTYAIGVRTLHLCMHEHYEDCPWREQALYAFDSRNQALYGYYAFGNYDFASTSFELLGRGLQDNLLLSLNAPGRSRIRAGEGFVDINMPMFSNVWISALADHWLYSGRPVLFDLFDRQIRLMLAAVFDRIDPETGLYMHPVGPDMWQFYEWEDGLAGSLGGDACSLGGEPDDARRLHAPYNLYLHEAIGSYAWMLEQAGRCAEAKLFRRRQKDLGLAIHSAFWNQKRSAYTTYLLDGEQQHYSELVQALALKAGIVPAAKFAVLLAHFTKGDLTPMTLSSRLYQLIAMMPHSSASRSIVADIIHSEWSEMVFAGATSFWETLLGGDDFDDAGSLCHGWSALPVYYYQAWILGVRPLEPGFKRFVINPYADSFTHASGIIPTPYGQISVRWERTPGGLIVDAAGPKELTPELISHPECKVLKASYNKKGVR